MGVLGAILTGLRRAFGSPRILLFLWLLNLLVALPAAVAIHDAIGDSLGASLADEGLRSGFDLGWYGEYRQQGSEFERTFRPSVVGIGAVLDNLDDWFRGDIFKQHGTLVALGVGWALVWTMLVGGVLRQVSRHAQSLTIATLLSTGARYFWRMLRLGLIAAVFYYWIYRTARALFPWIERATQDVTVERTVLFYNLLGAALILSMFLVVRVVFDYAKIAVVREDRRSVLMAMLRGAVFVLAHPIKASGVACAFVLFGLALTAVYALIAPGATQSTWTAVILAFLLSQLMLSLKLGLRVSLLGAQSAVYTGRSRHTIPRPL